MRYGMMAPLTADGFGRIWMGILIFLGRRLAGMAGIMVAVSLLVFGLLALSPGSTLAMLLGGRPASPEVVQALTEQYRLDDPFWVQYFSWLSRAGTGDFGRSTQSGEAVTSVIAAHLPVTIELSLFVLVLVLLIGIPAGMLSGLRPGRSFDRFASATAIISMSAPTFIVGLVLIYICGVQFAWFPVFGAGGPDLFDRIRHLTLPAIALATILIALVMRQTRAAVLGAADQDYVTFARARGVGRARVLRQYVFRNASLPIVTSTGLVMINAISGAVLVEYVFSLPGIGALMVQVVQANDIPVVQGLAVLIALFIVVITLVVDLITLAIDPRTRIGANA